jgi:hypothetical protein
MFDLDLGAALIGIGIGVAAHATYSGLRAALRFIPIRSHPVLESIAGTWDGDFDQTDASGKVSTYHLTLTLKTGRKTVKGTAIYNDNGTDTTVGLKGGFVDNRDRRLILSYKNADPAKLQHGELILSLSNDTKSLTGGFVGLGVVTNRIVSGSVNLIRKP